MTPWLPALTGLCLAAWAAADRPPDILLITADTLRADYLGAYGCAWPASPNLDRLAAESLVFEDCLCDAPLTAPSIGAMFASQAPRTHGATRNGMRIRDGIPTLAEHLRKAGYQTCCVQSTWTLKGALCGLDRGFDRYDEDFHHKRWGIVNPERPANKVTDAALRMLEERDPAKPLFLWVHYIDPHAPYVPHRDFNPSGEKAWRLRPKERARARYASEIAFMDHHIGRLLARIPPETRLVFTADHGESLYEHGCLGHGRHIYQDNLRIPLFIRAHDCAHGRRTDPAQGMDLAPTILGLAGLPEVPGMAGVDLLHHPPPPDRARFVETYGGAVQHLPGLRRHMEKSGPSHRGVILSGWKLIAPRGRAAELYHLPEDPGELRNLAPAAPDRTAEMLRLLADWTKNHPRTPKETTELTRDDREALKSLGYL